MTSRRPMPAPIRYTARGRRAGWALLALGWMIALTLGSWYAVTLAWVTT